MIPTNLPDPTPYPLVYIHLATKEAQSSGWGNSPWTSNVWPNANRANFYPFTIFRTIEVDALFCFNGTATSGNFDLGIYTMEGAKIVSTGPKVQGGTHRPQSISVVPSKVLTPGTYFMAMAADNITAQYYRRSTTGAGPGRILGYMLQENAFPLPQTIDPALNSQLNIFLFGLATNSPSSTM